jgi:hypothetical protein
MPQAAMDKASAMMTAHFEEKCRNERWSPAYIRCVLASTDPFTMKFDCGKLASPEMPGEFPDGTARVAPSDDISCSGVAVHMTALVQPDAATAELIARKFKHSQDALAKGMTATRDGIEASCTQNDWSEARRRCIASAPTSADLKSCP